MRAAAALLCFQWLSDAAPAASVVTPLPPSSSREAAALFRGAAAVTPGLLPGWGGRPGCGARAMKPRGKLGSAGVFDSASCLSENAPTSMSAPRFAGLIVRAQPPSQG